MLAELLRGRACSAVEITRSCLERIREREPTVRAFVHLDEEGAIHQARALDAQESRGLLHGIPIAVKDTVDVAGLRCTFGTDIHRDRVAPDDAEVVRRLRVSGAVILGTTVSTEYAIARAGPTTNPHGASRTPGGSSSGSAAAVAARMVPLAVGTQTIGSIVRPSTYCGIFGLKATKNAVPTAGAMPLSPVLDHVGPMARTVADLALAYRVMSGHRERREDNPGIVVRIEGPMDDRMEPATREALDRGQALLIDHGFEVQRRTLPASFAGVVKCWEMILFHDLARYHGADQEAFGDRMSERFREILAAGRKVSEAEYLQAIAEAQSYRATLLELVPNDAVVLAPATDGVAPPWSEQTGASYLQGLWSLTGLPTLAVPCGESAGLPIGIQLSARPNQEYFLLNVGKLFEPLMKRA